MGKRAEGGESKAGNVLSDIPQQLSSRAHPHVQNALLREQPIVGIYLRHFQKVVH